MDVIKVLVVEDDLIMWDAYPTMLESAREILIAGNVHSGIAALEFLESQQVDVRALKNGYEKPPPS